MRLRPIWKHPLFWLGLMVAVFLVVSCYSDVAAYDNFRSTSATNEGTISQAVSSTTFGHQVPFYESADCASRDRCSYLIVEAAFILFLAAPFYAIAPSTVTLLGLQSVVIGAAAIPLYWLTRQVTGSSKKALFSSALYLVWAPLLSTFTLHVEAVLPLEILGLAAIWQSGRYRWGLLAALIAFLSFEVAPIFVFLVGLFFLVPYGERWVRRRWRRWRGKEAVVPEGGPRTPGGRWWARGLWANRELRYTLVLLIVSVVALTAVVTFRNFWGGSVLGIVQPPLAGGIGSLFYGGPAVSSTAARSILEPSTFSWNVVFWLILLGLVGFLPILSPRSLVVWGPWILYTFLSASTHLTTLGQMYPLVDAGPIFIGVAYGLKRVPWTTPSPTSTLVPSPKETTASAHPPGILGSRGRSRVVRTAVVAVFTGVVVANLLLSPINPVLPGLGYQPGTPFTSDYFDHTLEITPGIEWADNLVSSIPLHATVAVSSTLYPLVGKYPDAFVMTPGLQPYADSVALDRLPINLSGGPQFVFVETAFLNDLQPKFAAVLSNPSDFGLRGYVSSTAIGPLLLYEQDYSLPSQRFGPVPPGLNATYAPKAGLMTGPEGRFVSNSSTPTGFEIRSVPKANSTADVWSGPNIFLQPGSYTLQLEVAAIGSGLGSNPTAPVLGLVGSGFGWSVPIRTLTASEFVSGVWMSVAMTLTIVNPIPLFSLEGFALEPKVSVAVASETISTAS